ncbi:hypothetical protein H2200_010216 [Cladophialophora chaetospira]|uniref:NACHT domain-containing protein n=1 Tax=Cladophialophora chaetospira TaxID=386627 RepID=A0AA38X2G9_9EURO|nr:hypothetical protein H2200_010216 [Cladophialophora chaetospira]
MLSLSRFKSRYQGQNKAGENDTILDPESFPSGIKILADPPSRLVDVVFVHGLTGDRERTWTSPATGTCWPRDLLPTFLPDARIVTFDYDAYVVRRHGQVAQIDISHHANDLLNHLANERRGLDSASKPVIFIAHSLGGVLCKDALAISEASVDADLRGIAKYTCGIAFVGTPHAGSWIATWAKTPATLLGVIERTDLTLLALLKPGSEILSRIHNHFLVSLRRRESNQNPIEVACFYETLPMLGKVQIVDQPSATIPGYNNISNHADHRDVARFPSKDHPSFKSIVGVLERWTQKGRVPDSSDDAEAFLETLAFKEMGVRQAIVETGETGTCTWLLESSIYQAWESSKDVETSHALLWIKGKPGSGKSTLMKYVASKNAQAEGVVRLVFFFNARGAEAEQNAEGLFKTFLHRLVCESRPMRNRLLTSYRKKKAMVGRRNTVTWDRAELRDLFFDALLFNQDSKVEIFVDALDECKENEVADIVAAFERCAAGYADRMSPDLKICWSSRHYPHISVAHGFELTVEAMNSYDIGLYVHRRLARSKVYEQLRAMEAEIVTKSQEVFLWSVLAMNKICKLADRGLPLDKIQRLIHDLPTELCTLYSEIVSTLDPVLADTANLMYLVLYTSRPLDANEIRLGIEFIRKEYPSSLEPFSSLSEQISSFRLYITELSGGLLEAIDSGFRSGSKRGKPLGTTEEYLGATDNLHPPESRRRSTYKPIKSFQLYDSKTRWIVQVIHETVRDYLTRDGVGQLPGQSSPLSLDPLTGHLRLYQFC